MTIFLEKCCRQEMPSFQRENVCVFVCVLEAFKIDSLNYNGKFKNVVDQMNLLRLSMAGFDLRSFIVLILKAHREQTS